MDGSPPVDLDRIKLQETPYIPLQPEKPKERKGARQRRLWLGAVAALALLGGAGYGTYWYLVARHYETTNDAFLGADSVTISPKVGGYVTELSVTDNQAVHKGDVLARIDPRDYQTAADTAAADLESAEANVANIDALLKEQQSTIAQAQAALAADEAAATFAQQELTRYGDLARTGAGSTQRQQQAQADLTQKKAALDRDRASVQAAQSHVAVLDSQRRQTVAAIDSKKAALAQAKLNLGYATIVAPTDGVIGDRSVRQGQLVQPGTRLLSVVPTGAVYLVANFKETQTGEMTVGQPVTVSIDSFPGQSVTGRVDSLAPGTGAQFALLPPENATGNFTKIVQRVPVKIVLDANNPLAARLRPGLSATVTVDIRPLSSSTQTANPQTPTPQTGVNQAQR